MKNSTFGLRVLRAKVIGFQKAGITISRQITKSHGSQKNALWNEKRLLGYESRHHLIAYGLLRGLKYESIEIPHKHNPANPYMITQIMNDHAKTYSGHVDPRRRESFTLDDVKGLVNRCVTNAPESIDSTQVTP
jgi:hypothetical protein